VREPTDSLQFRTRITAVAEPEIFIWGEAMAQAVWGIKSPSGFRGQSTFWGCGDKVPKNCEISECEILFTDFDCRNNQNLNYFAEFTS